MALALLLSLLIAAVPPRTPSEQAQLTALAEALGRAHGLHRLCAGPGDDLWRSRMGHMLDLEKPDAGLRQRLVDAFNAGFDSGKAAFPDCSLASRAALTEAEHAAADHARDLSAPARTP